MKVLISWLFTVITIVPMFLSLVIGFIAYPFIEGFKAGLEANEKATNKASDIIKKYNEKE